MNSTGISARIPRSLRFDASFAIRNFVGWLCFTVILTSLNLVMHGSDINREFRNNAGLMLCCYVGSFLIRMIIVSAGENASWRNIYFHAFAIAIPICSFLMAVLGIELHAIFMLGDYPDPHYSLIKGLFGVWFFMALLFSGWAGIFISTLAIQRSTKAEVERLESETALREAELRALKAQINPHFLFNSLNTIRALVNEHPDRAQDAVLHLSILLRAALQSESMLRTLRDELETTGHYLELEKMRFEERLNVSMDINPAAMDVMMPTMLLQTLVENAVKHGIASAVNGGVLRIEVRIACGRCIVRIANPGNLKGTTRGTGLGFKNAQMRLSKLIGEDSTLDLREVEGIVIAELNIPIKRDDRNTSCR